MSLRETYERILRELREAGFDPKDVLDYRYDPYDLFTNSPTLVRMAVDRISDELERAVKKPDMYIDGYGRFGYDIEVQLFVADILHDMNLVFTETDLEEL